MSLGSHLGDLTEPLTGRSWNHDEVLRRVIAHRLLWRARRSRGDRVFILYGNNLEFFVELLAIWHLGASLVPIDARLTTFEIENLARAVKPRLMLVNRAADPVLVAGLAALAVEIINTTEPDSAASGPFESNSFASKIRLDDEALILFTSGSTGTPKGVVHTHRSLRARWMALGQCLAIEPYRRTLCLLPTHFGHGLICNSLFPWLSGQHLFIVPPFSTDVLMRLGAIIDEYKITFLSSVPSMWGLALKASKPPQARTLNRIHCGSAPLSAHLWKQIQEWGNTDEVFNAYGITETGSWVAGTSLGEFVPEDGLVGVPWGAVIRILKSPESSAPFQIVDDTKADETGYIWINTPGLMQGYFGQQELTDEVVSGGWFLTGDLGLLDERGRLYLRGREREEINKGGTKIYPQDIDIVVERFERTREVCAFSVADPSYGQNVAMAVVLSDQEAPTIQALHGWMKRHLAEYKMPVRWYLLDSLPYNARGKINRSRVQECCAQLAPLDLQKNLRARL
jgi:acyl-CoA synthetase (AMP-forming)/AMP-acid ligase II